MELLETSQPRGVKNQLYMNCSLPETEIGEFQLFCQPSLG